MKYYVRRKTCKLKTNYIYHKMYTCFFLNSRPRKTKAMKFSGNGHKCNKVDVPIIMENLLRMYLNISI